MRVGFNARLLSEPSLRGFNRYTVNLLAELSTMGYHLYLYSQEQVHDSHLARLSPGSYELRESGKLHYIFWEQRWLPATCRRDKLDVFHSPFDFGLPLYCSCPTLLTIHDAIGKAYHSPRQSTRERLSADSLKSNLLQWIARKSATHIFTVSNHAKGDLIHYLGIPAHKISVTAEAADPRFALPISNERMKAVRDKYSLEKPYVFYTGGWETRKNLPFLLQGFLRSRLQDVELVLGGGTSLQDRQSIMRHVEELRLASKVRLLGWIADEDLPALYKSALCFVYPSEYEGFGLQLCEAMATGCPIICTNSSSLPEVLGNGGELVNLGDSERLAALLVRLRSDEDFRSELSGKARARAHFFSWRLAADLTASKYRELTSSFSR